METLLSVGDRLEIQDVLSSYAWSLDTGDEDAFVRCFCRQGELVWDVFDEPGCWRGTPALRRFISYFRARPESAGRQHHVSNLLITPGPDGAFARAYVLVALRAGEGPHRLNVMGYYEDELKREEGRWCISRRTIRDWSGPVLARLAGQDGARVGRTRPDTLDGLWETRSADPE